MNITKLVNNNLINKIFFAWIHIDVKLHLKDMEKNIRENNLKISKDYFITKHEKVIIYFEYFTSIIYSKKICLTVPLKSISDEADAISDIFLTAYFKGIKECDENSLNFFLPNPPNNPLSSESFKNKAYDDFVNKGPLNKIIDAIFKSLNKGDAKNSKFSKRKKKLFNLIPLPSPALYFLYILMNLKVIIMDIRYFSKEYNVSYHGDGEIRCFYNAMNMNLHFFITHERIHLSKKERLLVFAVSALHPAQDDLIDDIGCSKNDALAIKETLEGKTSLINTSESAKSVISLINILYKFYEPEKNPILVQIFLELHKWQLISKKQKSNLNALSEKELLLITFMKGGYAFALYGYVAQGNMSINQFRHYFAMGAIFQIMDDFHDIDDDLESNTISVFTRCVKNSEYIDNVMYGFISMQYAFENQICEPDNLKYPVLIRFVELFGSRFDTLRFYCMNKERFSRKFNETITHQIPFKMEEVIDFFTHTREHETIDNYTQVIREMEEKAKDLF